MPWVSRYAAVAAGTRGPRHRSGQPASSCRPADVDAPVGHRERRRGRGPDFPAPRRWRIAPTIPVLAAAATHAVSAAACSVSILPNLFRKEMFDGAPSLSASSASAASLWPVGTILRHGNGLGCRAPHTIPSGSVLPFILPRMLCNGPTRRLLMAGRLYATIGLSPKPRTVWAPSGAGRRNH